MRTNQSKSNIIIIGAGIIGLAVAYKLLLRQPHLQILIIEKEKQIAAHQTGNNSGVIHSGIYYKPGSFKAKNCVDGVRQLLQFCQENKIPIQPCGKLIIATEPSELNRLEKLYQHGVANGIQDLVLLKPEQIQALEPCVTKALQGLYSPHTSIVDYKRVAAALLQQIKERGGELLTETECLNIRSQQEGIVVETNRGDFQSDFLINCGGVWADDIARLTGPLKERMIPFRGEYYHLTNAIGNKIRGLIYPVPDPALPFLGVHLTRMIDGKVEAGPNAVLAFAKNGYSMSTISLKYCGGLIAYPGFWKMASKYWETGFYEIYRSFSKKAFLNSLQRLIPELTSDDILPGGSGVRAQLVRPDGSLCDDFVISHSNRIIHVLNAPSPAATACLSIADSLISKIFETEF